MKRLALIGTRKLPRHEVGRLQSAAMYYAEQGCTLLSGNAEGCDQAYGLGVNLFRPEALELYLPWPSYEHKWIVEGNVLFQAAQATREEIDLAELASAFGWDSIRETIRPLFIRNAMMAMRCDQVVAYPNLYRRGWGGTGHTMRCAGRLGKPVWFVQEQRWWHSRDGMPVAA